MCTDRVRNWLNVFAGGRESSRCICRRGCRRRLDDLTGTKVRYALQIGVGEWFSDIIARFDIWRGVRVAEGARLESVYAGNRIAGSNPALSAILKDPAMWSDLLISGVGVRFEPGCPKGWVRIGGKHAQEFTPSMQPKYSRDL